MRRQIVELGVIEPEEVDVALEVLRLGLDERPHLVERRSGAADVADHLLVQREQPLASGRARTRRPWTCNRGKSCPSRFLLRAAISSTVASAKPRAGKHPTRRIQDFRTPELGDDVLLGRTGMRGRIVERLLLGDHLVIIHDQLVSQLTESDYRSAIVDLSRTAYRRLRGATAFAAPFRSSSIAIGISDTTTIPRATSEKLAFTMGTFPNAYPAPTHVPTQSTRPRRCR